MIREQPLLLLIDDDPAMLHALAALFREEGYEIRTASNGTDGLRIAIEALPDLVIIDVVMPDIDGIEVCRDIRARSELDETVVIHLSAQRVEGDDHSVGLEAGADAYISLPVENRELIARVNSLLHLRWTEQNLRQSESRYRTLVESIPQLVWSCNPRGVCDYFSRQWRIYTGVDDLDAAGIDWLETIDVKDRDETRRRWEESLATEVPFEVEHRIRGANQESRWFKTRGVVVRDDRGKASRWLLTSSDVNSLVASREEVKKGKRELERTLADLVQAHEDIATLNEVGKSLSAELDARKLADLVTDAATRLTRSEFGAFFYNIEDQYGERYQLYAIAGAPKEAFSKFPMPRKTAIFSPTFNGTGVVRSDDITKDPRYGKNDPHFGMPEGHLPVVSYLAVPVVSRSSEVIGGLFFGHSKPGVFTAREEEMATSLASQAAIAMDNARLFNQLELKVRERTRQLEESLSELEAFSYTVSHDLRAPLRVMQSYAQIIEEDFGEMLDDTVRGYLGRIAASGARLDNLIQDLLTYSRVSRSNITMHPVELEPIIEDILSEYPEFRESEGVVEVDSPLPKVVGDESSLTQCLSNLIGNALKFMPPNRDPKVTVRGEKKGRYAIVHVSDNGIGIPEEHQERVFRIFERAVSSSVYEGTGIGLAIVKKAMDRMGGTISLSSTEGEGSTFELKFMRPEEETE